MKSFWQNLRRGLQRQIPPDKIGSGEKGDRLRISRKELRPFLARHWRKGAFCVFLTLLAGILDFPSPLVVRYLVDRVILGRELSLLVGAVLLLAAFKASSVGAGIWQHYSISRFEQEVVIDIQRSLLDRTLHFPKSFFDEKETGYLMSRLLGDVNGLRWFFSGTLIRVLASLLHFCGGVVLIFLLNWKLAVAVLAVLPLMFAAVRFFGRRQRILSHHSMERQAEVFSSVQESFSSATLIKAFSTEEKTVRRIASRLRSLFDVGMEQVSVGSAASLAIGAAPELGRLLVLIAGAWLIIKGQWTLGSLLAFQSYVAFVYAPAQFLATANLQLQSALASLERISALFEIVPEENSGRGIRCDRLQGRVEFRSVSFSYGGRKPILDGITFAAGPGEHLAIVGPSGVGKTTLLSLMLQFYRPSVGSILFDGRPAAEYELSSLRRRIGYVPQDCQLLSGAIRENIRYGNDAASDDAVIHAARTAGIHDFVASLPAGYETPLGERGINLSEGQRQRLAIARALVMDPDILILDEPTSALDQRTENTLFTALPEMIRGKTLFLVAHRLSTIRQAKRILLIEEGRLVADGGYEDLRRNQPLFSRLLAQTPE